MSFRTRLALLAGGWVAAATALIVAVPLLYRDRLPAPIATHWGPGGRPDNSFSFGTFLVVVLVMWCVLVAVGIGGATTGRRWRRRTTRAAAGALLAAGGVFVLGLQALTVWANLDARTWSAARPVSWQAVLVIAAAGLAGWLGWRLARLGPDERPDPSAAQPMPPMRLRTGERAVWASTATNVRLLGIGIALLAGAAVLAVLAGLGPLAGLWYVPVALAMVTVACLAVSSVGVQVNERGITIAYGAWRWPRRHVALAKIERAWTEHRRPTEVGGWGYRGWPGNATIMVRGGECLVIRYQAGGQLRISIDDAERGAALLTALLADREAARP